ncbi:hypothetical protein CDL15_Pgr017179 [Punica granatum]|uniref:Integrase catalytic domain-containing protein n=1 Tax=Punica granatum TaxID=22663 RepID=A0A218W0P0_PUNGR|nr:hypothetical protein CDL15_Pgr017179 [Punica granatum]
MIPTLSKVSQLECQSCQLGKHTRTQFPSRVSKRASAPFVLVHSDIWGPCPVLSSQGYRYFETFIDDYSIMTWVYLLKNRSDLYPIFVSFCSEIQTQFGVSIRTLRSDNAREYFSTSFQSYMSSRGMIHQSSCAYTPQQNGVAERKNRHLIETFRTLLIHMNVPVKFWGDALLTACYLINRMPSSVLHGQIPFSVLFPRDAIYSLPPRIFGCLCFIHQLLPGSSKLSPRSLKCVFLGYLRGQKGYRCYSPEQRRYFVVADVTFFESTPFFSASPNQPPSLSESLPLPSPYVIVPFSVPSTSTSPPETPETPSTSRPTEPRELITYQRRKNVPHIESQQVERVQVTSSERPEDSTPIPVAPPASDLPLMSSPELDLPIAHRKGTRSTANPYPLYNFLSYSRLSPSYTAFLSSLDSVSIPRSVKEALSHPGWREAMIDEMSALDTNGTWELVSLPLGKTVVGCRWVYTVKTSPNGRVDRLKACLVAKGYTQIPGLDYGDTFSPVAKVASVRLLLSLAAINHWSLHQLDIKNAFLHGDLEEKVYMEQPPGFVAQGEYFGKVCKLRKSLYGLKQSPRAWFGRFSSAVIKFGLVRSQFDHSVFFRHYGGRHILLVVYVDDIVITGDDVVGISQLKTYLHSQFQTKDLGALRYFLGIEVAQSERGIYISQRKYVLDILEETELLECKPVDPNVKLAPGEGEPFLDVGRYRRLVGKLNYLTVTRPDISFAVSVVSQFLDSPTETHWNAVI